MELINKVISSKKHFRYKKCIAIFFEIVKQDKCFVGRYYCWKRVEKIQVICVRKLTWYYTWNAASYMASQDKIVKKGQGMEENRAKLS